MSEQFAAGDDLIFQLESGYGLLRVIAIVAWVIRGVSWRRLLSLHWRSNWFR